MRRRTLTHTIKMSPVHFHCGSCRKERKDAGIQVTNWPNQTNTINNISSIKSVQLGHLKNKLWKCIYKLKLRWQVYTFKFPINYNLTFFFKLWWCYSHVQRLFQFLPPKETGTHVVIKLRQTHIGNTSSESSRCWKLLWSCLVVQL